jgi:hypothetical protein
MNLTDISLDRLNDEGFLFFEYDPAPFLDVKQEIVRLQKFKDWLWVNSPRGSHVYGDMDIMKKGEELKLHYHVVPGPWQVVLWLPVTNFEGREFLYGSPGRINKIKPRAGLACMMKPNDPKFVHGVAPLLDDGVVKSYGFTCAIGKFDDSNINDIYI